MRIRKMTPFAAAALLLAGCSIFRWSGRPHSDIDAPGKWSAADLVISTEIAHARPTASLVAENLPLTLYYTDLGPDTIDIADYPAQQKYNYAVFAHECSRCHTLARAVNSPVKSRLYWRFHIARMSLHSRLNRLGPISAEETKSILDFLEYDAQIRKVQHKGDFERQNAELQRRFEPILKELIERLQTSRQPILNPPTDR